LSGAGDGGFAVTDGSVVGVGAADSMVGSLIFVSTVLLSSAIASPFRIKYRIFVLCSDIKPKGYGLFAYPSLSFCVCCKIAGF
jgi:hypothetical protein